MKSLSAGITASGPDREILHISNTPDAAMTPRAVHVPMISRSKKRRQMIRWTTARMEKTPQ